VELGEKPEQIHRCRGGVLARDVELRAIARRHDDRFGGGMALDQ
jgi:hypothetical protein